MDIKIIKPIRTAKYGELKVDQVIKDVIESTGRYLINIGHAVEIVEEKKRTVPKMANKRKQPKMENK